MLQSTNRPRLNQQGIKRGLPAQLALMQLLKGWWDVCLRSVLCTVEPGPLSIPALDGNAWIKNDLF